MNFTEIAKELDDNAATVGNALAQALQVAGMIPGHAAAVQTVIDVAPRLEAAVAELEKALPTVAAVAASHRSILQKLEELGLDIIDPADAAAAAPAPAPAPAPAAAPVAEPAAQVTGVVDELATAPVQPAAPTEEPPAATV